MRRFALYGLASLAAVSAFGVVAEAQAQDRPLALRVSPRSFLDPGNVVAPGSLNTYAVQSHRSYLTNPPWDHRRDQFGEGVLPDPVVGPFVGAENPFGDTIFRPDPVLTTGSIR